MTLQTIVNKTISYYSLILCSTLFISSYYYIYNNYIRKRIYVLVAPEHRLLFFFFFFSTLLIKLLQLTKIQLFVLWLCENVVVERKRDKSKEEWIDGWIWVRCKGWEITLYGGVGGMTDRVLLRECKKKNWIYFNK